MTSIPLAKRLILALDTPDLESALDLVRRTKGVVGTFKVGLELYTAVGPPVLRALRKEGADVFLDLKLHDIPNTVAGAVRAAAKHEVSFLTVHTSGGKAMLKAAQEALSGLTQIPGASTTQLLGVTVLTHLAGKDLTAIGFAGGPGGTPDPDDIVSRLAGLAQSAGLFGVVCSPEEAARVKAETQGAASLAQGALGPLAIVCPGIRGKESARGAVDDQARTATAKDAVSAGADYVVVGRPIRSAPDPAEAAAKILEEIELGLQARAP